MKSRCIAPTGAARTRYGERPRYREGLHDLGRGIHAWMVPNGSWGEANAGLVTGEGASLLIDTLWDVPKTRAMLGAMTPLLKQAPLVMAVNTHADGDHFWGNELLGDADTITSAAARAEMDHHRPGSMLALARLGTLLMLIPFPALRKAGHYFQAMAAPYAFETVTHTPARRTFSGRTDLDIGGRRVELIEVGPAHTYGDLIVHVPDARTVFAADILFIGSTPVMWTGPVENWIAALDLMLGLGADIFVPGHGPVTNRTGVRSVKDYWEFTRDAARRQFESGVPAARAARDIVMGPAFRKRPFARWNSPERMTTNVHVLYRHWRGRSGPMGLVEKVNLLRRQALLAHALTEAAPAVMRLGAAAPRKTKPK